MNRIRLALQKEGRLSNNSVRILEKIGVGPENGARSLFSECRNFEMDLLWLRDDDIPQYVQSGSCELGIAGENVIFEKQIEVDILQKLDFGKCELKLLAPPELDLSRLENLNGLRIATSYPNLTKTFLRSNQLNCKIIFVAGSVEVTPRLNIADAVVDLVSTGQTAKINGLEEKMTLLKSQAVLFATTDYRNKLPAEKIQKIEELCLRIKSSLNSAQMRYLMMNAPKENLGALVKIIPGVLSPTILELQDSQMIALHAIIKEQDVWKVLPLAKKLGACDFISTSIDAYMP